jgi:branched-chain amino acid transport system substrate-binding protein
MIKRVRQRWANAVSAACVLAAVTVGIAACGSSAPAGGGRGSSNQVLIGASVPITGALAAFGSYVSWGYQHAVNVVNSQGGVTVNGHKEKVKLILLDDTSDPNTDANNVERLITQDHVVGLLGSCTPPLVNAGALVGNRNRVPFLTGCAPVETFTSVTHWTYAWDIFFSEVALFNVPFETLQDYHEQSNHLVAVLHDNESDGIFAGKDYPTVAARYGYKVVVDDSFPVNADTFTSELAQVKASGAQIVLVDAQTPSAIALRKQMVSAGVRPKFLTIEKGGEPAQFAAALGALANGVTVGGYWDPAFPYPGAATLARLYSQQTGHTPSQHLADSTTAADVLLDAINRANSTDPAKVNAQIADTNKTYVLGHIQFGADHAAVVPVVEGQWQGGAYEIVGPERSEAQKPLIYPMG